MTLAVPIRYREELQLTSLGVKAANIRFNTITMDSDRFICVVEKTGEESQAVIVDLKDPTSPMRKPISADSAVMNPVSKIIALRSNSPNDGSTLLQIVHLELKTILKTHVVRSDVSFMKWISDSTLSLITDNAVFHWVLEGDSIPVKVFERNPSLKDYQIINYRSDQRKLWFVLIGIASEQNRVIGKLQLYSVERQCFQIIEGYAACFAQFKFEGNPDVSNLMCFVNSSLPHHKLHIVEIGQQPAGNKTIPKRNIDIFFPAEALHDFPIALQSSLKYGVLYLITKLGYLYIYDIESVSCIYMNRITSDTIFVTAPFESSGGIIGVNRKGQVLTVTIDEAEIVAYIKNVLKNIDLAFRFAARNNLPGADELFIDKFNCLFDKGDYSGAAKVVAMSPMGCLRTPETYQRFQETKQSSGQGSPILKYFEAILERSQLNKFESLEICRLLLLQGKKNILEEWLKQSKLECCEELGDMVKNVDAVLALSIYLRASIPDKVVQCFSECGQYDKILNYAKKVNYTPDYRFLFQNLMVTNPEKGLDFAMVLLNNGDPLIDISFAAETFIAKSMIQQCTAFLLEALKKDEPDEGDLQTRVLEINLLSVPQVADAILGSQMFSHYDKKFVAKLCEKSGLFLRALENYTDLENIKRVIVRTDFLDMNWLVGYFGTMSVDDSLECLKTLMSSDPQKNLGICLQVVEKYYKQLSIDSVVELFTNINASEGIFCFLGSIIHLIQDSEIYFKYIKSACELGQMKVVEQICRDCNYFCPEKVKNYLKQASITNHLSFVILCDRFNYIQDLISFLHSKKQLAFVETLVRNVNPSRLPEVVGLLLDLDCSEDFITNLITSVHGKYSIEELLSEMEKRNRLTILLPWLKHKCNEGCNDVAVHNALAKIYIDANSNPEQFLRENEFYDSNVVGKYCESRDPHLACIAYERGECGDELINVYTENALFKQAANYLVRKKDRVLWNKVLGVENEFRKHVIDQIVHSVLIKTNDPDDVSETIKAFLSVNLLNDLVKLLEKLLTENTSFSKETNLQNLIILTAMKANKERVIGYIESMNHYSADEIARIAVNTGLHSEALAIYKKFRIYDSAMGVILKQFDNLEEGQKFAEECNDDSVWFQLGQAQLNRGLIKDAIASFLKSSNPSSCAQVVKAAHEINEWEDLIKYLQMACKQTKDPFIQGELLFAYAKTGKYQELEECIAVPNNGNINEIGDRCFSNELYEAAKLLFNNTSNFAKLAITMIKLNEFQGAVESARKAKRVEIWKEVCFACLNNEEFKLAQTCALHIIVHSEELDELTSYYEERGFSDQLIKVIEAGLIQERAHMGMFTQLAVLYSKYRPEKLMDHLELFWSRINIRKVVCAVEAEHLWKELVFLYEKYEDYDRAVSTILEHPVISWNELQFQDIILKVSNQDLFFKSIDFYLEFKPLRINDFLIAISSKLDNSGAVQYISNCGHLKLIKPYLCSVQYLNDEVINDALNDLLIEEDDFESLKSSLSIYGNFNALSLAQRLENHELMEFRSIAAYLYKRTKRWTDSIQLCKANFMLKEAIECARESKCQELVENLLEWFLVEGKNDCFAACLFQCYEMMRPDVVLELAWQYQTWDFAMPYMIQVVRDYIEKVAALEEVITRQGEERSVCPEQPQVVNGRLISLPFNHLPIVSNNGGTMLTY